MSDWVRLPVDDALPDWLVRIPVLWLAPNLPGGFREGNKPRASRRSLLEKEVGPLLSILANDASNNGLAAAVARIRVCERCGHVGEVRAIYGMKDVRDGSFLHAAVCGDGPLDSNVVVLSCTPEICGECGCLEYPGRLRRVDGRDRCRLCVGTWEDRGSAHLRGHVDRCTEVECETCSGVLSPLMRRDDRHNLHISPDYDGWGGYISTCWGMWGCDFESPVFTTISGAHLAWIEHAYDVTVERRLTPHESAGELALFDAKPARVAKPLSLSGRAPRLRPAEPTLFDDVA